MQTIFIAYLGHDPETKATRLDSHARPGCRAVLVQVKPPCWAEVDLDGNHTIVTADRRKQLTLKDALDAGLVSAVGPDPSQHLLDTLHRTTMCNDVWSQVVVRLAARACDPSDYRLEHDGGGVVLVGPEGREMAKVAEPEWWTPHTRRHAKEVADRLLDQLD